MKKRIGTILLIVVLLAGLSLLLYPTVSNYWNTLHSSRAVTNYVETVANISNEDYEELIEAARLYNASLVGTSLRDRLLPSDDEHEKYLETLDITGTGIMGYVNIPSIDVSLPIYHTTDDSVLQIGVGHLEGTSLPVGGENTHSALSGHRGLPSAKLFTNLDKLIEGDTFTINILDETLTYQVDQIRTVLPDEVSDLEIINGGDYCTLVTCTPYGINTHRLLVRARRIENAAEILDVRVSADGTKIENIVVAPIVAVPFLGIALILMAISGKRRT